MSLVVRWTFTDTTTDEKVVLPINPNEASPPSSARTFQWAWGSRQGLNRVRGISRPTPPTEWTFGGVIRTKEHYDLLLEWSKRDSIVHVTDHLERTFEIMIKGFEPTERLPTGSTPWRATYTMTCLLLKEVTA